MKAGSTFEPLQQRQFLFVLAASLLSNLGNAVQSVGAAWQLTVTGQPADLVASVQSATNLPIMLLALPAGAWADTVDRRRLMLLAQRGMFALSVLLAILTYGATASPALIIGLTALLASGIACFNPAVSASLGIVVPRRQLAAAVALNILAFNLARSAGPALGGLVVALGGAQLAFLVSGASYLLVIAIVASWPAPAQDPTQRRPIHTIIGEGLRFAARSREIVTIGFRAFTFTSAGAAPWALMPLVASQLLARGSIAFGLLLGALGLGAVLGAVTSTAIRAKYPSETITRAASVVFGIVCFGVSRGPSLPAMLILLVIGGAGWVQALSGFAVAGQLWSPRQVVGRVTALVSSLTFGGIAIGSWFWGHVSQSLGVTAALSASGIAMVFLPLLGLLLPMPRHHGPSADAPPV